jgi:hypothetical protein
MNEYTNDYYTYSHEKLGDKTIFDGYWNALETWFKSNGISGIGIFEEMKYNKDGFNRKYNLIIQDMVSELFIFMRVFDYSSSVSFTHYELAKTWTEENPNANKSMFSILNVRDLFAYTFIKKYHGRKTILRNQVKVPDNLEIEMIKAEESDKQ